MRLYVNPEDFQIMRICLKIQTFGFLSERHLRGYKRKQQQVMAFRSQEGLGFLCDSLGIIASIVKQGSNLFECVADIFMPVGI